MMSKKIVTEARASATTKRKSTKVKNENSLDASTNGNEIESTTTSSKSRKKKNEQTKSVRSKSKKSSNADKAKEEKQHKKKKKKKRNLTTPAMHYTAAVEPQLVDGDLSPEIFSQCKEKMRPVKKALKQLDNPDKEISKEESEAKYKKCLLKIGGRITSCLNEIDELERKKEWRNNLWTFVSRFTEYDPKRLYKIYKHTFKKQNKELEKASGSSKHHHHYHHDNGDATTNQNSHNSSNQYSHHHHSSSAFHSSSNLTSSSSSNSYQTKLSNNNLNKFTTSNQRHTSFQGKEIASSYHAYGEKRSQLNLNSPNKRLKSDDYQLNRSVSNKPVSPSSNQLNRSNNSWHNTSARNTSFDNSNANDRYVLTLCVNDYNFTLN